MMGQCGIGGVDSGDGGVGEGISTTDSLCELLCEIGSSGCGGVCDAVADIIQVIVNGVGPVVVVGLCLRRGLLFPG